MSNTPFNLEIPEAMGDTQLEHDIELSDEQWERHMAEIMHIGEDENASERPANEDNEQSNEANLQAPEHINITYAIVFARCNKVAVHFGPRLREDNIVQIIGPEHDGIETLYPTDDEVEIRNWRVIPCLARIQYNGYWASFKCKLQECTSVPMDFVLADTDTNPYVTQCRMKHMGADGNDNVLLWVNMTLTINNSTWEYELCGKRIVADEETKLDADEMRYVWEEEVLMEW